jgi:hypothetical protein
MKLQIDYIDVSSLVDYAKNARTHSAAQVTQIANSIREFGFNNPVLIDGKGEIIAGHGRVLAAKQLNMEQVPCVMLGHLSERQKRAYVLADNKIALNSGWDFAKLSDELSYLADVSSTCRSPASMSRSWMRCSVTTRVFYRKVVWILKRYRYELMSAPQKETAKMMRLFLRNLQSGQPR